VAAAAVAATIVATHPSAVTEAAAHSSAEAESEATSDATRIQLSGYIFTLPDSFGARDGSCELNLPDGTTRSGTPGADGACAVLLDASVKPSWLSDNWPAGVWAINISDYGPEFATLTITGRLAASDRYLVLAVKLPRAAQSDPGVEDFEKILNDGLAANQSAPN
jgi:hypothetical protein